MLLVEKIVIAIVQPSFRREEYLDVWETTPEALNGFTDDHGISVVIAETDGIAPVIGSWCSFCPAESTCPGPCSAVETSRPGRIRPDSLEDE